MCLALRYTLASGREEAQVWFCAHGVPGEKDIRHRDISKHATSKCAMKGYHPGTWKAGGVPHKKGVGLDAGPHHCHHHHGYHHLCQHH